MKKQGSGRLGFNVFSSSVFFLLGVYFTANQTMADVICEYFKQGTAAKGVMVGLLFFGMAASALVSGEVSERTGRKTTINAGFILVAAGIVLALLAQNFALVCAGVFLSGIGFGSTEGMISSAAAEENSPNSARALNITQAFFSTGAVVSPFIIGRYLRAGGSWRLVLAIIGALYLILLLFSMRLRYGARRPDTEKVKGVVTFSLFKKPVFVIYLILILFYVGAESGLGFWVVRYFNEVASAPALGELSISLFWLGTLVTRLVATRVRDYRALVVASFALAALGTALFVFLPTPPLKVAAFGFAALAMGPLWPTLFSLGSLQHPNYSGAAFGVMMVFSSLGGTLLQPAIGKIVEKAPISSAYWLITFLCLAMALLMLVNIRLEKKPAPQDCQQLDPPAAG